MPFKKQNSEKDLFQYGLKTHIDLNLFCYILNYGIYKIGG